MQRGIHLAACSGIPAAPVLRALPNNALAALRFQDRRRAKPG